MREKLKAAVRGLLQGVIWVFVLSIRVDGRTLFHHAHDVLVNNQVVAAVEVQATRAMKAALDTASSGADGLADRISKGFGAPNGRNRG